MKAWAKGGLIGFAVVFIGLWIFLLIAGHSAEGWQCINLRGKAPCTLLNFIFSPFHIGFVLFFSWVGFFGGLIDAKKIKKILEEEKEEKKIPLKITIIITLTLVIVFGVIGILAFDNWVKTMIYAIIFGFFAILVGWFIGKKKYGIK